MLSKIDLGQTFDGWALPLWALTTMGLNCFIIDYYRSLNLLKFDAKASGSRQKRVLIRTRAH